MVKYWIDYISNKGTSIDGYRTLEGFVTDIVDWIRSEHDDPEEMLYLYEEHNKSEGFYIKQN